ncbi:hypothetical protein [Caudoviricetes sp.]|nr:hypothetical protein [Caudoviricetes sp.]UOF79153.1 hypothetical protein [Caudoviricetes sp.]
MATRFYLPSSGTSPLPSLAGHTGWATDATPNARRPMSTSKTNTSVVETGETTTGVSQERNNIQFCSPPLAAQSFLNTDTYNGIIKCKEDNANRNIFLASVCYIVSSDGSTIRGTLYNDTVGGSDIEFPTTANEATRAISDAFIGSHSSVDSQDGDYLILEVGIACNASATAGTGTMQFLDDNASDYAFTTGLTTDLNPWFELSRNVVFKSSSSNQLMMTGCGT